MLLSPTYVNVLNVFAFCNLDDVRPLFPSPPAFSLTQSQTDLLGHETANGAAAARPRRGDAEPAESGRRRGPRRRRGRERDVRGEPREPARPQAAPGRARRARVRPRAGGARLLRERAHECAAVLGAVERECAVCGAGLLGAECLGLLGLASGGDTRRRGPRVDVLGEQHTLADEGVHDVHPRLCCADEHYSAYPLLQFRAESRRADTSGQRFTGSTLYLIIRVFTG